MLCWHLDFMSLAPKLLLIRCCSVCSLLMFVQLHPISCIQRILISLSCISLKSISSPSLCCNVLFKLILHTRMWCRSTDLILSPKYVSSFSSSFILQPVAARGRVGCFPVPLLFLHGVRATHRDLLVGGDGGLTRAMDYRVHLVVVSVTFSA